MFSFDFVSTGNSCSWWLYECTSPLLYWWSQYRRRYQEAGLWTTCCIRHTRKSLWYPLNYGLAFYLWFCVSSSILLISRYHYSKTSLFKSVLMNEFSSKQLITTTKISSRILTMYYMLPVNLLFSWSGCILWKVNWFKIAA